MQKAERHQIILDLIGAMRIGRQDELVRALADRGYTVTQASVSRDLDELGIVKLNGAYAQPQRNMDGLGIGLLSVEAAGPNMVVVKTVPGLASATTVRIDAAKLPGIVGTIAGEDTIFIAVEGENKQRGVIKGLWELF
jgi:transcriptional regulator of arginine metabolism